MSLARTCRSACEWASRVTTVGLDVRRAAAARGTWLDRWLGTSPLGLLVGAVLGFAVGMMSILRIAREGTGGGPDEAGRTDEPRDRADARPRIDRRTQRDLATMAGHGDSPSPTWSTTPRWNCPTGSSRTRWEIDLPKVAGFQVTRFMVTEVVAAVLVALVVIPLARHVARQHVTRGPFLNLFEAMVLFIRDQVARPAIGGHGADALPAVPLDGLLLRPVQQPARADPGHGLGDGQHQRDGRAGVDDAGHGPVRRDAGDGRRSGSGSGSCRTWTSPAGSSRSSGA